MEIRNRTPLVAGWTALLDRTGAEQLILCARGTWSLDEQGHLALMTEPPPLLPADQHVGEPGLSSVRHEADLGPLKPATDCALVGSAVAPRGRARRVEVAFRVGALGQRAIVTGERRRLFWLLRWWSSPARAFERVPLVWELAAGGSDTTPKDEKRHSLDLRNPLGRGFRARGSKAPRRGALLPQILPAGGFGPFGRPRGPVGFGLTGGHWAHRRRWAGTYDEAWQKERCPLLPDDFDERFHNAAAPGLVSKEHLVGGERVEVRGCTRAGRLAFRLPRVALAARARFGETEEPIDLRLHTVTVDTDAMQLRMLWRGGVRVHRRLLALTRLELEMHEGRS
jgi:hypothetical protein